MAIKRSERRLLAQQIKQLQTQVGKYEKKKSAKEKKLSSSLGALTEIDPVQIAYLGIAFLIDLILGLFQILSFGLLGVVEWILKIALYACIGVFSLALVLVSGVRNKDFASILVVFVGSFIIEVIPLLSALPAISAFALRLIISINKAKLEKEVAKLKQQIKDINKQIKQLEDREKPAENKEANKPQQEPGTMRIGHTVPGGALERKYGPNASGTTVNPNDQQYKQAA